jgi:hypothetical protein
MRDEGSKAKTGDRFASWNASLSKLKRWRWWRSCRSREKRKRERKIRW